MPSSQKTTIRNEKLSSKEVVKILAQVLAKAKKFAGPALLIVEFPTEYTRKETAAELGKKLEEAKDELVDIDLRKPINLLEIIEELKPNQVGSVHGLHAQPEVVRRLNWGRERLTDNNKRIVFWLNFEELKDLAERAPDFWAFRNRHLTLESLASNSLDYSHHLLPTFEQSEVSNLSADAKHNRIESLEELLLGNKSDDVLRKWQIFLRLGHLYWEIGDFEHALNYQSKALEIAKKFHFKSNEANTLGNMGIAYAAQGNYDQAIQMYKQALTIHRKLKDSKAESNDLNHLGSVYLELAEYTKAKRYYTKSLKIKQENKDKSGEGSVLGNLGVIYHRLGQFEEAIEYYNKSLRIAVETQDSKNQALRLGNLGIAFSHIDENQKALQYHQKALQISQRIGAKEQQASSLGNMGIVYRDLGEYVKALDSHQRSLEIFQEIGSVQGEANQVSNIGSIEVELGNYGQAIEHHKKSLLIYAKIRDKYNEAISLNDLGASYSRWNRIKEAVICYVFSIAIFTKLKTDKRKLPIRNLTFLYYSKNLEEVIHQIFAMPFQTYEEIIGLPHSLIQFPRFESPNYLIWLIEEIGIDELTELLPSA